MAVRFLPRSTIEGYLRINMYSPAPYTGRQRRLLKFDSVVKSRG